MPHGDGSHPKCTMVLRTLLSCARSGAFLCTILHRAPQADAVAANSDAVAAHGVADAARGVVRELGVPLSELAGSSGAVGFEFPSG